MTINVDMHTFKLETLGHSGLAFAMACEADLQEVFVRPGPNPRSLQILVLVSYYDNFTLWT